MNFDFLLHEPIKRKKEGEDKRMSQKEMLLYAAQAEIINLTYLERVLVRKEEVEKRAIVHKAVYSGPQLRYFSKDGCSYLEFSRGLSFQSEISTTSAPSAGTGKNTCVCPAKKLRLEDDTSIDCSPFIAAANGR